MVIPPKPNNASTKMMSLIKSPTFLYAKNPETFPLISSTPIRLSSMSFRPNVCCELGVSDTSRQEDYLVSGFPRTPLLHPRSPVYLSRTPLDTYDSYY